MGVFGQGSNPLRGAPEERLGQENGLLGAGPQGTGSAPPIKKGLPKSKKPPLPPQKKNSKIGVTPVGLISHTGGPIGIC